MSGYFYLQQAKDSQKAKENNLAANIKSNLKNTK